VNPAWQIIVTMKENAMDLKKNTEPSLNVSFLFWGVD
jgi:hypothetical protein